MKVFLFVLFFSFNAWASSLSLDLGQTKTNYNRFSIPTNVASQLEMPQGEGIASYRLTGYIDLASRNQFYFLLAPLQVEYSLNAVSNFRFNNTNFTSGSTTNVTYKFNSYRVGYLWTWTNSNLKYWLGAVGKIRDAKIEVIQASVRDQYDNVGFVPLAAFGFEWPLGSHFSIFFHTDALAASQGAAYDAHFELRYRLGSIATSLGARILGGGAENERVYSFAQFDTTYARFSLIF
jgi:hypothetical protein